MVRISLALLLLCLPNLICLQASGRARGPQEKTPSETAPSPREPRRQEGPDVVSLKGQLVSLDALVVDRENRLYPELEKKNFTIYENGVKQDLSFFSKEESPISLGLVIDTSKSMSKKLSKVIAAAKSLVAQSRPGDEVCLIEFKAEAELVVDFTPETREIQDALDELVASGQTALLDAVFLGARHGHGRGKFRRKAIVVITDGDERDSYYTRDQLLQSLKEADVQVYSIGFAENLDDYGYNVFRGTGEGRRGKAEKRARRLLDEIGVVSGGHAFFPENLDELPGIASAISRELRTQYILGYYPTNTALDGTWREVKIEVNSDKIREKLIARARTGYYSAKEGSPPKSSPEAPAPRRLSKPRPN